MASLDERLAALDRANARNRRARKRARRLGISGRATSNPDLPGSERVSPRTRRTTARNQRGQGARRPAERNRPGSAALRADQTNVARVKRLARTQRIMARAPQPSARVKAALRRVEAGNRISRGDYDAVKGYQRRQDRFIKKYSGGQGPTGVRLNYIKLADRYQRQAAFAKERPFRLAAAGLAKEADKFAAEAENRRDLGGVSHSIGGALTGRDRLKLDLSIATPWGVQDYDPSMWDPALLLGGAGAGARVLVGAGRGAANTGRALRLGGQAVARQTPRSVARGLVRAPAAAGRGLVVGGQRARAAVAARASRYGGRIRGLRTPRASARKWHLARPAAVRGKTVAGSVGRKAITSGTTRVGTKVVKLSAASAIAGGAGPFLSGAGPLESITDENKVLKWANRPTDGWIAGFVHDAVGAPASVVPGMAMLGSGLIQLAASFGSDARILAGLWQGWKETSAFPALASLDFGEFIHRVRQHPIYFALELSAGLHLADRAHFAKASRRAGRDLAAGRAPITFAGTGAAPDQVIPRRYRKGTVQKKVQMKYDKAVDAAFAKANRGETLTLGESLLVMRNSADNVKIALGRARERQRRIDHGAGVLTREQAEAHKLATAVEFEARKILLRSGMSQAEARIHDIGVSAVATDLIRNADEARAIADAWRGGPDLGIEGNFARDQNIAGLDAYVAATPETRAAIHEAADFLKGEQEVIAFEAASRGVLNRARMWGAANLVRETAWHGARREFVGPTQPGAKAQAAAARKAVTRAKEKERQAQKTVPKREANAVETAKQVEVRLRAERKQAQKEHDAIEAKRTKATEKKAAATQTPPHKGWVTKKEGGGRSTKTHPSGFKIEANHGGVKFRVKDPRGKVVGQAKDAPAALKLAKEKIAAAHERSARAKAAAEKRKAAAATPGKWEKKGTDYTYGDWTVRKVRTEGRGRGVIVAYVVLDKAGKNQRTVNKLVEAKAFVEAQAPKRQPTPAHVSKLQNAVKRHEDAEQAVKDRERDAKQARIAKGKEATEARKAAEQAVKDADEAVARATGTDVPGGYWRMERAADENAVPVIETRAAQDVAVGDQIVGDGVFGGIVKRVTRTKDDQVRVWTDRSGKKSVVWERQEPLKVQTGTRPRRVFDAEGPASGQPIPIEDRGNLFISQRRLGMNEVGGTPGRGAGKVSEKPRTGANLASGGARMDASARQATNDNLLQLAVHRRYEADVEARHVGTVPDEVAGDRAAAVEWAANSLDPEAQAFRNNAGITKGDTEALVAVKRNFSKDYHDAAVELMEGNWTPENLRKFENGGLSGAVTAAGDAPDSTFGVAVKSEWDRLTQHEVNMRDPAWKQLRAVSTFFKSAVLPFSPNWYLGNYFDVNMRSMMSGQLPVIPGLPKGKHNRLAERAMAEATESRLGLDNPAQSTGAATAYGEAEASRVGPFEKQLARDRKVRRSATNLQQQFNDWRAGRSKDPVKMYGSAVDFLLHMNTKYLESPAVQKRLGKLLARDLKELTAQQGKAHNAAELAWRDLVKGLKNTNNQYAYAREIAKWFGDWTALSPAGRNYATALVPFYLWARAALRFVYLSMPAEHPIWGGILAAAAMASEPQRNALGLDIFGKDPLPGYRQGNIGLPGGDLVSVNRLNTFGVFSNGPLDLAKFLMPYGSSATLGAVGVDWKGDPLTDSSGNPVPPDTAAKVALLSAAEAFIPGLSLMNKINARGRYVVTPGLGFGYGPARIDLVPARYGEGHEKDPFLTTLKHVFVPPSKIVKSADREKVRIKPKKKKRLSR